MMSTAIGASENMIYISDEHRRFYHETLQRCHVQDVYHKALCYCLGICENTRNNFGRIYDVKRALVKPEVLHEGWQTSGSVKVVRMAFNLFCNGMSSVEDDMKADDVLEEASKYSAEDLFCSSYAPFFWQAIQIRYPEYATYNYKIHEMLGGRD